MSPEDLKKELRVVWSMPIAQASVVRNSPSTVIHVGLKEAAAVLNNPLSTKQSLTEGI